MEDVYVNDSSTDVVANTMPTAASMSTDLYGMCTLDACRQILVRLKPIREKLGPDANLAEIANAAHMERVDLTAHGFYAPHDSRIGYDFFKEKPADFPDDAPENSWKGHPFNYFTQGVAYTEVEIDVLTGNHRTLFSDVIVDVGSSVNPAIDIGQIEGAFTQGMGWGTIEDIVYGDDDHTWVRPRGNLFTAGPGTYKLPGTFPVSLFIHTLPYVRTPEAKPLTHDCFPLFQPSMINQKYSMYHCWKTWTTPLPCTVVRPLVSLHSFLDPAFSMQSKML